MPLNWNTFDIFYVFFLDRFSFLRLAEPTFGAGSGGPCSEWPCNAVVTPASRCSGSRSRSPSRAIRAGPCSPPPVGVESRQLSLVAVPAMIHMALGDIANTRSRGLSVTRDDANLSYCWTSYSNTWFAVHSVSGHRLVFTSCNMTPRTAILGPVSEEVSPSLSVLNTPLVVVYLALRFSTPSPVLSSQHSCGHPRGQID